MNNPFTIHIISPSRWFVKSMEGYMRGALDQPTIHTTDGTNLGALQFNNTQLLIVDTQSLGESEVLSLPYNIRNELSSAEGIIVKETPPQQIAQSLSVVLGGATCRPPPSSETSRYTLPNHLLAKLDKEQTRIAEMLIKGESFSQIVHKTGIEPKICIKLARQVMKLIKTQGYKKDSPNENGPASKSYTLQ